MPDFKSMRAPSDQNADDRPIGLLGEGLTILERALYKDVPLAETMEGLERVVFGGHITPSFIDYEDAHRSRH